MGNVVYKMTPDIKIIGYQVEEIGNNKDLQYEKK